MIKSKRINLQYLTALLIFALISAWLSYYIYLTSTSLYVEAENTILQLQQKRKAVNGMAMVARNRSIILFSMIAEKDIFIRDDLLLKMSDQATLFNENMTKYESSKLTKDEHVLFNLIMKKVRHNAPHHIKVAELLVEDKINVANKLLFDVVIPNQETVINEFKKLLNLVDYNVSLELEKLKQLQSDTNKYIFQLVTLVLVAIFVLFNAIYSRTMKREVELKTLVAERTKQSEQAHAQVNSLVENSSEGIVSVDKNQNIILFNPAAEKIFQYKKEDVIGRSLDRLLPDDVHHNHHGYLKEFGNNKVSHSKLMSSRSEVRGKRSDGELFNAEASISKSIVNGETYFTAFIRDITERVEAESKIKQLAMFDSLTGLANRHHFEDELNDAVSYSKRYPDYKICLFLLDLDLFKQVNDKYGHAVGDALLVKVAKVLERNVRDIDIVGRYGGDEFSILIRKAENIEDVDIIAKKLIQAISTIDHVENCGISIGVSIGITFCPEQGIDVEQLLKQADQAMYEAKGAGRNTYRIYS